MLNNSVKRIIKPLSLLSFVALSAWLASAAFNSTINEKTQSYIISAENYSLLKKEVRALNLVPSHELAIINSVAVALKPSQLAQLHQSLEIKVSQNHSVELSGGKAWGKRQWQPKSVVNTLIDASAAHNAYNFGDDVTIGFLDTGLDQLQGTSSGLGLSTDLYSRDKFWGTYNAINNTISNYSDEENGHGTHVASVAGNADYDVYGKVYGVAPNASLVGIKAFDSEGKATYADVIRGIDWALQVKDQINLRVLNMSFSGPVRSHYWDDPLNQAVMKAWQAGIVVVASAGNTGPDPMTIGVPGNVPYIITVGAMTDSYTDNLYDDKLATFSSAGPTVEGFVKPEIVAPGGHLSGLMAYDTQIAMEHPEFHDGGKYFEMSGTSQAAGVVSGVVALMLTQEPTLTPDEVKCRLMDSAHTAMKDNGKIAYSVFQQGAGMVNAAGALNSNAAGCANQALDIAQDISGDEHFFGPANINDDGNFYIEGLGDEYVWRLDDNTLDGNTVLWRMNFVENAIDWRNIASATDTVLWRMNIETDTVLWRMNLESNTVLWRMSVANSTTGINANNWVEQQ